MAKKSIVTDTLVFSRCIMLSIYETDAMIPARIRGFLSSSLCEYIELQNSFFITCESDFKTVLNKMLTEENIRFSLIYISAKNGNRVYSNKIPAEDVNKLNLYFKL